jgi:purine-binding chemotaxis protein CheW
MNQLPAVPMADPDLQFVVCVVADERYGIEVGRVHEIIRWTATTALPGADQSFNGVLNLRGRVIPVMDLRERLGLPRIEPTRHTRIVVADVEEARIGLVVDSVEEVVRVPAKAIEPAPTFPSSDAREHMTGIAKIGDGLLVVLALEHLLARPIVADPADTMAGASA